MNNTYNFTTQSTFLDRLKNYQPNAYAIIKGNNDNPELNGTVYLYETENGVLVETELFNLPFSSPDNNIKFYGMHIHEFGDCTLPFDKTGNHYNPLNEPHPMHAGDMPPLLGNSGYAYSVFYTERFTIPEILQHSFIIHGSPDDFITQPSGNSGEKIGCGVIKRYQK